MARDQASIRFETRWSPRFRTGAIPWGWTRSRGRPWARARVGNRAGTRSGDRYKDWLALFDAHQVQFLLLDTEQDRGLLQAARANPQWAVDCVDGSSVLLARAGAQ